MTIFTKKDDTFHKKKAFLSVFTPKIAKKSVISHQFNTVSSSRFTSVFAKKRSKKHSKKASKKAFLR